MITANCFDKFTNRDFNFICEALSTDRHNPFFEKIYRNELHILLDIEDIFRKVVNSADLTQISTTFYFYLLARKALKPVNDKVELAQYFANFLDYFATRTVGKFYLSDFISKRTDFHTEETIANQILFLLGVMQAKMDAPDFYASISKKSFAHLATSREARACQMSEIYGMIADDYGDIKRALADTSERVIFISI